MGQLDHSKLRAAAGCLAAAFEGYPLLDWVLEGAVAPSAARLTVFDALLRHFGYPSGTVWGSACLEGVAVWIDSTRIPRTDCRASGILADLARANGRVGLRRSILAESQMQAHHPEAPHLYLYLIGVIPTCRERGIGRTLLKAGLRRADREGVGVFLETSMERNIAFYSRRGFMIRDCYRTASGSPSTWTMWREPVRRRL